jgi:3-methyladenine DNA glycosylase/8-oxoguanine DNA glycosylase
MHRDPFRSLLQAIIYQQLARSAADAMYGRFLKIYGRFSKPE